jgi:hypothetical protein
MFPVDGIRSQLEWCAHLNTVNAVQPTEKTKFLRKVSLFCSQAPIFGKTP